MLLPAALRCLNFWVSTPANFSVILLALIYNACDTVGAVHLNCFFCCCALHHYSCLTRSASSCC
jgi:hypothetical protein